MLVFFLFKIGFRFITKRRNAIADNYKKRFFYKNIKTSFILRAFTFFVLAKKLFVASKTKGNFLPLAIGAKMDTVNYIFFKSFVLFRRQYNKIFLLQIKTR